jgi:glucose 1-dehydrogenase
MEKRLKNKVAWVTGAARGMGRGIAFCLADQGADIALNDLNDPETVQEALDEIAVRGQKGRYWQADVRDREAIGRVLAEIVAEFGYLDICVANAGINISELVAEAQWENVFRTIEVTQFGVFHTCQAAAKQMIQQVKAGQRQGGKIIITGSVHEELAVRASAAYNMAKAAVTQLGRTLAVELAPYKINVNVIHPGLTDTPGTRGATSDDRLQRAAGRIPWGRLGKPDDIGKAAAFLASEDADYITGVTLRVDGGFTLGTRLPLDD